MLGLFPSCIRVVLGLNEDGDPLTFVLPSDQAIQVTSRAFDDTAMWQDDDSILQNICNSLSDAFFNQPVICISVLPRRLQFFS